MSYLRDNPEESSSSFGSSSSSHCHSHSDSLSCSSDTPAKFGNLMSKFKTALIESTATKKTPEWQSQRTE